MTITGQTQALIVVDLYVSNVTLIICTFGLVLGAFLTLV
jgi:hypothetical protein